MKKRNLIIFFTSLLSFLLFFDCKSYEQEFCTVEVYNAEHCTYELDKTYVPKNSFVKLKVYPEAGYYFDYEYYSYYKSPDEENTYYIQITKTYHYIYLEIREKTYHSISRPGEINCTILLDKEIAYEGDKVTFTIIPDDFFYYDLSSVKVLKGYSYVEIDKAKTVDFTQSSENPNNFSFIMPESPVAIFTNMKFCVTATSQKEVYSYNENLVFNIDNPLPEQTFDLVISENFEGLRYSEQPNNYVMIAENVTLSEKYELPQNGLITKDGGSFLLKIFPHGNTKISGNTVFSVNSNFTPEGWRTVGIKDEPYYWEYNHILCYIYLLLSNCPRYDEHIMVKYTIENEDSTQTIESNVLLERNEKLFLDLSEIIDENIDLHSFNTFTVWIEDNNLKYISKKIIINIKNQNY